MSRLRAFALLGLVGVASTQLDACAYAQPGRGPSTANAQLTCNDSTAPLASYRRAVQSRRSVDSTADLVVLALDGNPPRPAAGAHIQLWGDGWAAGGPTDSSGVAKYENRPSGLMRLSVRRVGAQPRPWQYAVTLRARYADTVIVDFAKSCSLLFGNTYAEAATNP